MENLPYEFVMPIGDWSDDGHGKCDEYFFQSNKDISFVREAHFKIKKELGIDIDEVCSDYEDSHIEQDVKEAVELLEFDFKQDDFYEDDNTYVPTTSGMARLWAFLLQKAEPELVLLQKETSTIPSIIYYGYDSSQRHISGPGYGLFD